MSRIVENVTLDIDGNMWHLNNGICLGDPRSLNGFGATIQEAIDDFKYEFRPSAIGNLPLDLKPFVEGGFVGIEVNTTNLKRIGYNHRLNQLFIQYNNDKRYCYLDVPVNIWEKFLIADCKTEYHNRTIKGEYRYTALNG